MDCKIKCDNNNNGGNWNYLKIINEISEQHTWKARNQGTVEKSLGALYGPLIFYTLPVSVHCKLKSFSSVALTGVSAGSIVEGLT